MATANPAMNEAVYRRAARADTTSTVMTLPGTVLKTAILLVLLVTAASYTWGLCLRNDPQLAYGLAVGGAIAGFITALITIFRPLSAPITAPIYAICEGLFLGTISAIFQKMFEKTHPGIVPQAVGLTFGTLAVMLFIFATGIIRATAKVKMGIVAATGAIFLVYLVDIIARLFGAGLPFIHESGAIGIGFSVVVVIIAALNLILDFDFIQQGVRYQAPKAMEWYGGFSLLVTLVWMYLEILRLLAKLAEARN